MIGGLSCFAACYGGVGRDLQPCADARGNVLAMRLSLQMLSRKTPSDQMRRGGGGLGRTLVAVAFLGLDSRFDRFYDGLQLAFNIRAVFSIQAL